MAQGNQIETEEYIKKHGVLKLMQDLTTKLLYSKPGIFYAIIANPDNPKQFLINTLQEELNVLFHQPFRLR